MKFLHISDLHIGSPMTTHLAPKQVTERTQEIIETFERSVKFIDLTLHCIERVAEVTVIKQFKFYLICAVAYYTAGRKSVVLYTVELRYKVGRECRTRLGIGVSAKIHTVGVCQY